VLVTCVKSLGGSLCEVVSFFVFLDFLGLRLGLELGVGLLYFFEVLGETGQQVHM
jgi:hypothetical protein